MDPITTVILAAIVAGVASGATEVSKQALVDSYNGVKSLLKAKYGPKSDLYDAVEKVEANPDSASRQGLLQEEVEKANADRDAEILAAVEALETQLRQQGDTRIQTILDSAGSEQTMKGRGGHAEQHIEGSPDSKQRME